VNLDYVKILRADAGCLIRQSRGASDSATVSGSRQARQHDRSSNLNS
jgi:hypothetical protein